MDATTVLAFAAAFFAFAASPGPDNLNIVARTLSHGPASGLAQGAGVTAGILVFLVSVLLGLSALAPRAAMILPALGLAGAAYLVGMGIALWRARPVPPTVRGGVSTGRGLLGVFATGIVLNLANPKMPLFYAVLVPSVAGSGLGWPEVALLAFVVLAVEVIVVGAHVALASRARHLLSSREAVRAANRAAGVAMVAAGLALAASGLADPATTALAAR